MKKINYYFILFLIVFVSGCTNTEQKEDTKAEPKENLEAKSLLQGIWVDDLTEDVVFKIDGDTIHYPDNTSLSVYFKVVGDTLVVGNTPDKYYISSLSANVFHFTDHSGELLNLVKSRVESDSVFFKEKVSQPIIMGQLIKRDTIVYYNNTRYRIYTTINPSKYKVYKSTLNEDGIKVENVYYDNIINIAVFIGRDKQYSHNFNKNEFANSIPAAILKRSVFGNMDFANIDKDGFHFRATIGVPDEPGAYVVDTIVYKP